MSSANFRNFISASASIFSLTSLSLKELVTFVSEEDFSAVRLRVAILDQSLDVWERALFGFVSTDTQKKTAGSRDSHLPRVHHARRRDALAGSGWSSS